MDWSEIAQKYNIKCSVETLRKSSTFPFGGRFRSQYTKQIEIPNLKNDSEYFKELDTKKRELEQAKIQFRDERNAWNRQNYIDARVTHKLNKLEQELLQLGQINFKENLNNQIIKSDNDILIILSDLHIGACFSSLFGSYNSTIAKQRLNHLLNKVIQLQKIYNCENCYISLQGDLISGSIHKTIQVTNRENVIDQIKIATEYISSFAYSLTKHFNQVFLSNVSGNHTRIDRKDEALHDERLDDLISWATGLLLNNVSNFHLISNNLDTGIVDLEIRENHYIAVHGDLDPFNQNSMQNLCTMIGFIPYAVLYGHLHTCAFSEVNGIKMIRGGCLSGSGDDYTIEKRLYGKASQLVCVCSKNGLESFNPIQLS